MQKKNKKIKSEVCIKKKNCCTTIQSVCIIDKKIELIKQFFYCCTNEERKVYIETDNGRVN